MKLTKLTLIYIFITISFAQFGQNIVQYDKFDWSFIQSEHFDIYYTNDGLEHAEFVAIEAEIAGKNIASLLDCELSNRVSIIVYNSHNDFQQTNVLDSYMYEGIGGVTELYKNRVVIPFDGSIAEFKHVIHHELVHAYINDYVYGGTLNNLISSQIKFQIPLWMNEGLAEYIASTWDTNSDMWLRDLTINGGDLPKINQLYGYWAYRGGQSVWKFITQKWGDEAIAEIIFQIKETNGIESGIKEALGVDLELLTEQWHESLKKNYWPDINIRQHLSDIAKPLTDHKKLENTYNIGPAMSPDGSKIAIYSNKSGPMGIYLISAQDGRFIKKILTGQQSAEYEELHILKPGITWAPDGETIAFSAKSGKSDALHTVNIITDEKKQYRLDMEGIFRPVWSPINNEIVFIGNNGKQSDIYILDLTTEALINMTDDIYTDDHVSWSSDGKHLIFISDRGEKENQMDIFSISTKTHEIKQISNTHFDEGYPLYSNDPNQIVFIADEFGINNIYTQNLQNAIREPLTNVMTGVSQLSWGESNAHLLFSGFENSGYDIYVMKNPLDNTKKIEIPMTNWVNNEKLPMLKRKDRRAQNSSQSYINYTFSNYKTNTVDTSKIELAESDVMDSTGHYKSYRYKTKFSLDNAMAYYAFDTQYSGQGMAYFQFSDILGDHKIYLITEMDIDLKYSDYLLHYRYLPNQTDLNFTFSHLAYEYILDDPYDDYYPEFLLYQNIGVELSASRPFSRFSKIEGLFQINSISATYSYPISQTSSTINYKDTLLYRNHYLLPSIKYVWDNTSWESWYPNDGSRMYLKYRLSSDKINENLSFQTLTMDSRYYRPLFNHISFAGRIFAGSSWGEHARKFWLGGTPWLFSSDKLRYNEPNDSVENDVFLSEYVTPIRGYQIASKYGHNALLCNLELRLPFLIYYFPSIKFLGQINGVIFADIGVAWDDEFPNITDYNNWNNNDSNGWMMSFGFGPRFILLGMPWQLDYAWNYSPYDGIITNRKWYLTIGIDF
jgi:Tol biopolymer transport system component